MVITQLTIFVDSKDHSKVIKKVPFLYETKEGNLIYTSNNDVKTEWEIVEIQADVIFEFDVTCIIRTIVLNYSLNNL